MRGVDLNDGLIGRTTGKEKVAFDFLKTSNQNRNGFLSERYFTSGRLCLAERIEDIALFQMNILAANAANLLGTHSSFEHQRCDVSQWLGRSEKI